MHKGRTLSSQLRTNAFYHWSKTPFSTKLYYDDCVQYHITSQTRNIAYGSTLTPTNPTHCHPCLPPSTGKVALVDWSIIRWAPPQMGGNIMKTLSRLFWPFKCAVGKKGREVMVTGAGKIRVRTTSWSSYEPTCPYPVGPRGTWVWGDMKVSNNIDCIFQK